MMDVVGPGTQKIQMNSADDDYNSKLKSAQAQADGNPYVAGMQEVFKEGAGEEVKMSRSTYGNPNIMPEEVLEGEESNFAQNDFPGNQVYGQVLNTTGNMDDEVSATTVPQEDPAQFQTEALDKRLQLYANAGQGFPGLNNRAQTAQA